MSRIVLSEVIEKLEEEFEEAEALYTGSCEDDMLNEVPLVPEESFSMDSSSQSLELSTPEPVSNGIQSSSSDNVSTGQGPSSASLGDHNTSVEFDSSLEDEEERQKIEEFIQRSCKCSSSPSKSPCNKLFDKDTIAEARRNCLQLTSSQLELLIMGQILALRTHKDTIPASYKGTASKFRPHTSFMFQGIKICQEMFPFLHCIFKEQASQAL